VKDYRCHADTFQTLHTRLDREWVVCRN